MLFFSCEAFDCGSVGCPEAFAYSQQLAVPPALELQELWAAAQTTAMVLFVLPTLFQSISCRIFAVNFPPILLEVRFFTDFFVDVVPGSRISRYV